MQIAEKKYHYTYQTKNLINGKTYVGVHSTNDIKDGYLGSGDRLREAIRLHGKQSFVTHILCFFDTKEEAYEEEGYLVDKNWVVSRNNYNVTTGGSIPPSWLGRKMSEEAKAKISASNRGKVRSEETRKKISQIQIGKKPSIESRKKQSIAMTGLVRGPQSEEHKRKLKESWSKKPKFYSEEARAKIRASNRAQVYSPERREKMRQARKEINLKKAYPTVVFCKKTNINLGVYFSVKDIVSKLGSSIAAVQKSIYKNNVHKKFHFISCR